MASSIIKPYTRDVFNAQELLKIKSLKITLCDCIFLAENKRGSKQQRRCDEKETI
ncbi:hypothetical protein D3C87_2035160 [compost metagenome]